MTAEIRNDVQRAADVMLMDGSVTNSAFCHCSCLLVLCKFKVQLYKCKAACSILFVFYLHSRPRVSFLLHRVLSDFIIIIRPSHACIYHVFLSFTPLDNREIKTLLFFCDRLNLQHIGFESVVVEKNLVN